jgi:hypothetical protein
MSPAALEIEGCVGGGRFSKMTMKSICRKNMQCIISTEVLKLWGSVGPGGKQVGCMRDIFVMNQIWLQGKICILIDTFLA